jgi:orotate phosphoribosyltransferase
MKDPRATYSFINAIWKYGILEFGEFTLKSGRISPYFFNAGRFNTGEKIKTLANAYAQTIQESKLDFSVLFGPSYKGIPLCVAASIAMSERNKYCGFSFNRKEEKDHGDGGLIVGHSLHDQRVLLIDDVMTSGSSFYTSASIVRQRGGVVVGGIVVFDRQEKAQGVEGSVMHYVASMLSVPLFSIIDLNDVAELCPPEYEDAMNLYRLSMCV